MPVFENIEGATPIDDVSALIPTHITTKSELDEWETTNILKATKKHLSKRRKIKITVEWLKIVHKDMFDETWGWAGKFRNHGANVGVAPSKIREQIKFLVDDVSHWQVEDSNLGVFEQSVRIHHRLVYIHPFENGNGRHARLVADIFLFSHQQKLPKWPSKELIESTDIRKKYIEALKTADKGNYVPLEEFTKSLID